MTRTHSEVSNLKRRVTQLRNGLETMKVRHEREMTERIAKIEYAEIMLARAQAAEEDA